MPLHAQLDTHIRVPKAELSADVIEEIKQALSIRNQDKIAAIREKLPDALELPDTIDMWAETDSRLILPRGFLQKFTQGMESMNRIIIWDDQRASVPMDDEFRSDLQAIDLREHQEPAVRAMLMHEQGIYEAPPASGKTVTVLEAIRRSGQRAIILVDKSTLAQQWKERAQEFLGVSVGILGDGIWDPGEITVALKQSLWSRRHALAEADFFDEWGFMAYDECHHVTADTYQKVVQWFPAKYQIGVSATPNRIPWTFPIAKALLGEIIHETPRELLQDKGILVIPKIMVVPTTFYEQFRATKVRNGYRVGNNYHRIMKKLVESNDRNGLIATHIAANHGHHQLVVGKRFEHFDRIEAILQGWGFPDPILRLTGKENRAEREEVQNFAAEHPCVVFSTVADEGLDIPRLDRIHLIWPTRNVSVVRQQVGRVERVHPDKADAIVYDYYDAKTGVLKSQFSDRMAGVYRAEELETEYLQQETA